MRKLLHIIIVAALALMFLFGLTKAVLTLPLFQYLRWVYPDLLIIWVEEPTSWGFIFVDLCMMGLPFFALLLWIQDGKKRAGDYCVRHERGTITVSETALRRLVRSVCQDLPNLTDDVVELVRSGSGLNIQVRVRVDRADSWPFVKSELLRRIPEELEKVIGEGAIGALDITWTDFASGERGFPRLTATPVPDVQPERLEEEQEASPVDEAEAAEAVGDELDRDIEPYAVPEPEFEIEETPTDDGVPGKATEAQIWSEVNAAVAEVAIEPEDESPPLLDELEDVTAREASDEAEDREGEEKEGERKDEENPFSAL